MSGGDDPLANLRNIPLDRVAAALGYRTDPGDRRRFRREGSIVSIDGEKFFDHLRGAGGGGAIDFVIHATGCGFAQALRFLAGQERHGSAGAIPGAPRRLRLPGPSRRAWPGVRDGPRRPARPCAPTCSKPATAAACSTPMTGATPSSCAATPPGNPPAPNSSAPRRRPAQGASGAWPPGSRKARGGFWLPCDRNRPAVVILAESALDAISARTLRIEATREHGRRRRLNRRRRQLGPRPGSRTGEPKRIVCAYDADGAGDDAAHRLAVNDPESAPAAPPRRQGLE